MTTRQTVIGVKGPEHAITYDEDHRRPSENDTALRLT